MSTEPAAAQLEKRRGEVERQLEGLITALAEGFRAPGLKARLDSLEAEKVQLGRRLAAPPPSPVRLHPNLAELYRRKVEALHEALHREEDARRGVRAAARADGEGRGAPACGRLV